jgi:hypothetical protein
MTDSGEDELTGGAGTVRLRKYVEIERIEEHGDERKRG